MERKKIEQIKKRLDVHYIELADILTENKIEKLMMTTLGNSIATGFALNHKYVPLIQRVSKELDLTLKKEEIEFVAHDLALIVNNFLLDDKFVQDIIKINKIHWFQDENVKVIPPKYQITLDYLDLIYSYMNDSKSRVSDVLFSENSAVSNILIYSGLTSRSLGLLYNNEAKTIINPFELIKQDEVYSRHSMSFINEKNRKGSNTQVYILGNPDYFGLGLIDAVYNKKLKLTAKTFPCTNYVDSLSTKMFYKTKLKNDCQFDGIEKMRFMEFLCKHTGIVNDPHYNEEEYLRVLEKLFISIKKNFLQTKISIELDRLITSECNQNGLNMSYVQPEGIIDKIDEVLDSNNLSNEQKTRSSIVIFYIVTPLKTSIYGKKI